MEHQAIKDNDFLVMGKKKKLTKPYDCFTHNLESVSKP